MPLDQLILLKKKLEEIENNLNFLENERCDLDIIKEDLDNNDLSLNNLKREKNDLESKRRSDFCI